MPMFFYNIFLYTAFDKLLKVSSYNDHFLSSRKITQRAKQHLIKVKLNGWRGIRMVVQFPKGAEVEKHGCEPQLQVFYVIQELFVVITHLHNLS